MKWMILLCVLPLPAFAQQLDSCGIDNHSKLNYSEAAYFNTRFQKECGEFTFRDKRLVFITGESGTILGGKQDYFNQVRQWKVEHGRDYLGGAMMIPFTENQKLQSGGYDAIVTYWTKVQPSVDRVIRRINRKSEKE